MGFRPVGVRIIFVPMLTSRMFSWSRWCKNFAGRLRYAGERQAFRLPALGTPIASYWGWQNSSNAMRRSENKSCVAIGRTGPLIQTLPRLNTCGGREPGPRP